MMNFLALRMLIGDRAKYLGLIFSIAFASFLIAQQASIFIGLMSRTTSQVQDVVDADIWVMDRQTQYADEVRAFSDDELYRVRGVPGIQWAVRLFKGMATTRSEDGKFRQVILLGLDDATLVGGPHTMLLGQLNDLRRPDAIVIDRAGYEFFFPHEPLRLGRTMEMNDHRAVIVGICEASPPFATFPVVFTRYSQAVNYIGQVRDQLSFVLAKAVAGVSVKEACNRIERYTDLKAMSRQQFAGQTIGYYIKNTGIPVNFGITISVALIVGSVVAGQTFYIFTLENLKQFGALKAIGVTNYRLIGMILLQALVVAAIGYATGMGLAAAFFELTLHRTATRGIVMLWPTMAGTGCIIFAIVILASLLSIRKVLVLEPAIVFRG
jgi:putative ABC transport system permease protein